MPNSPKPKIVSRKHLARLERERRQRRYILIGAAVVALIVIVSIVYGLLDANVFQFNQPVAKVGDQTITVRDFQNGVRFQRYQLINQYNQYYQFFTQFQGDPFGMRSQLDQISSTLTQTTTLGSDVLDKLIEDIVIAKEAAKRGITVSDDELNKSYQAIFGYFPNGTPTSTMTPTEVITSTLNPTELAIVTITPTPSNTPTPSDTPTSTLAATLAVSETAGAASATPTVVAATATPAGPTETPTITPTPTVYTTQLYSTSVAGFITNLKPINIGEPEIRKLLLSQLLRQKLTEAMGLEVATSQDEVWARHIVVADEATANTVETRLKNGEDFAKVANEVSTDSATKATGGDMGWFAKGVQDPAVEAAAFAQTIGQIGPPVKSSLGYDIIQVIGHEVRALSASDLSTARSNAFSAWLKTQTADPSVVKYDLWSQKVPTDPVFTPPVLPAAATQPAVVVPTGPAPLATPQ